MVWAQWAQMAVIRSSLQRGYPFSARFARAARTISQSKNTPHPPAHIQQAMRYPLSQSCLSGDSRDTSGERIGTQNSAMPQRGTHSGNAHRKTRAAKSDNTQNMPPMADTKRSALKILPRICMGFLLLRNQVLQLPQFLRRQVAVFHKAHDHLGQRAVIYAAEKTAAFRHLAIAFRRPLSAARLCRHPVLFSG